MCIGTPERTKEAIAGDVLQFGSFQKQTQDKDMGVSDLIPR